MRAPYLVLALVALTACNQKKDSGRSGEGSVGVLTSAAPRDAKNLGVMWAEENTFYVRGAPGKHGGVYLFRDTYTVTIQGFPKGTTWVVGDRKGVIKFDYDILAAAQVTEKMGAMPADPSKLRDARLDPEATLHLELPSGEKLDIKLPPSALRTSLEDMLEKVDSGPVLFGAEPPDEKPLENILFLHAVTPELFGRASEVREVDAVAKATQRRGVKGTKMCAGYLDRHGKSAMALKLELKETEVVVYERRTGKIVAKKVFPPDPTCPMVSFHTADRTSTESFIPTDDIKAWLRTQIHPFQGH